ncbi:MAG TPA: hypothetical protein VGB20_05025 [bacterium]
MTDTHARRTREGGFFLLASLALLVAMTTLFSTTAGRSAVDLRASERALWQQQAFELSEAGMDHALSVLNVSSLQWDDELRGPDGMGGTADDGTLSFGQNVGHAPGSYDVRVNDNFDEVSPAPSDPMADVDGVLRVVSAGTVQGVTQRVEVFVWALFNHAIAADIDIHLHESSAMGNIHANRDINVYETGTLFGNAQATATGDFNLIGGTLNYTYGDLIGGDPRIRFMFPNAEAIEAAVDRWNPPHSGTISLAANEIVGYRIGASIEPGTVVTPGPSTIVMFDANEIRFREKIGTFDADGNCTSMVPVNVISLSGGITFEETACINGLIWANGPIVLGERSTVRGAIVSAGSSVTVSEHSHITFDRSVLEGGVLTGFWGVTMLSWQEL